MTFHLENYLGIKVKGAIMKTWLKEKETLKDLSAANKQYKAIRRKIETIRTEVIKIHDYIMENYWEKLTTGEAYNLGMIGSKFICKDFPGDFCIDILVSCYKIIVGIKKRVEGKK